MIVLKLKRRRRPANVRLTSEPQIGAEFAHTSEASRKLRDNRRDWLKRLLADHKNKQNRLFKINSI